MGDSSPSTKTNPSAATADFVSFYRQAVDFCLPEPVMPKPSVIVTAITTKEGEVQSVTTMKIGVLWLLCKCSISYLNHSTKEFLANSRYRPQIVPYPKIDGYAVERSYPETESCKS
jgi:hypothetical protein